MVADGEGVRARLSEAGVVPILRVADAERALALGGALAGAGVGVLEVSFNTPDAPAVIERLAEEHPGVVVGAGTVLRPEEAARAAGAGARFLLSPAFHPEVARAARDLGCPYIPGAFTATEVWRVIEAGLDMFKLFPAGLYGVAGMRTLLEPFPGLGVVPSGGIGLGEVGAWRAAGAVAVGLGGAITRAPDPVAAARAALAAARVPRAEPV
ncbi:MAG: bifunctional 4-hydroxy-2-oxoglutarate aldolase/2-dehydro-3-deoxy-phosphogluconate aldolase [Firmicutes bacterium]|nr:bifunctional 4-hydroxy-2-oxoglutarate aldolase/2-dehydro-3-deoxy-phosphogluconate aldolase [Bacillota bacterium]